MNHDERRERRKEIVRQALAGVSPKKLAEIYGMSTVYIRAIILKQDLPFKKKSPRKTPARKLSEAQQAENCKKAEERFRLWKAKHLHTCKDYKGKCCASCHAHGDLVVVELKDGDFAYLCCGKAGLFERRGKTRQYLR